jgi:hypothetical protein
MGAASATVAAEGAPRHHRAGPCQPECLEAPQYHPAANQTEAAPEKHQSTAASRRNHSRWRGRRRGQRRRWAELVAQRSRSVEGHLLETAGGDRGGQDLPESAGGGVRGNLGVESGEVRKRRVRPDWPIGRSGRPVLVRPADRPGQNGPVGPNWLRPTYSVKSAQSEIKKGIC